MEDNLMDYILDINDFVGIFEQENKTEKEGIILSILFDFVHVYNV